MMTVCKYSEKIVDYLYNELFDNERTEFEAHLTSCNHCTTLLADFSETKHVFKKRKQPLPGKKFLKAYYQNLKEIYQGESAVTLWMRGIIQNVIIGPRLTVRLAEVMIILLVGIFIGKNISSRTEVIDSYQIQNIVDKEFLDNYLFQSEFLLLEVSNIDNVIELRSILKEINCNTLLQKTIFLKEQATKSKNQKLYNLLERLEIILLELANIENALTKEELNFVRRNINELRIIAGLKELTI